MAKKKKVDLSFIADMWPSPIVPRCEIFKFSGGTVTSRHIANLDNLGEGPANRMRIGRKVVYPVAGSNGGLAWFAFPQLKIEQDGETKYLDILQLTNSEREAVSAIILAETIITRNRAGMTFPFRGICTGKDILTEIYSTV